MNNPFVIPLNDEQENDPQNSYYSRVTALITAVDNLGGLLDCDLAAVKPWADEIEALQEAVRQINTPEPPPVFVCVRGGCVTLVTDETGAPHPFPVIIDHDTEDDGACPVCGDDLGETCEGCGYEPAKDNALECAVKHYAQ